MLWIPPAGLTENSRAVANLDSVMADCYEDLDEVRGKRGGSEMGCSA